MCKYSFQNVYIKSKFWREVKGHFLHFCPHIWIVFMSTSTSSCLWTTEWLPQLSCTSAVCVSLPPTFTFTATATSCPSPLGYRRPTYLHAACFHVRVPERRLFTPHSVSSLHKETSSHMAELCCVPQSEAALNCSIFLPLGWLNACVDHHLTQVTCRCVAGFIFTLFFVCVCAHT